MGNNRSFLAVLAVLVAAAAPAHAQPVDYSAAIGGGVGTIVGWWYPDRIGGGHVRVSVPIDNRGDLEFLGAMATSGKDGADVVAFYGAQYRQRLRQSGNGVLPFVTYGAIGLYTHDRGHTSVSLPAIGLVGAGVEYPLARRVAVRAEAQAIVFLVVPFAVRAAAGVSIGIGAHTP